MTTRTLASVDFDYIRKIVHERSAIVLDEGKEYLVEARLGPVARQEGFQSIHFLVAALRSNPYNGIHQKVVEALPPMKPLSSGMHGPLPH